MRERKRKSVIESERVRQMRYGVEREEECARKKERER